MLLLKTDNTLGNTNLPTFLQSADERSILSYGPTVWLEGDAKYIQISAGVFAAWVDRVSGRRYVPGRSEAPGIAVYGSKTICRFGFRPNQVTDPVTVAVNGVLKPEDDWEALSISGTYTLAVIARMPKPKNQEGSELTGSNDGNSGGTMVGNAIDTDYFRMTGNYGNGDLVASNQYSHNMFTPAGAKDDGLWYAYLLSSSITDNTAHIYVDGTLLASNNASIVALSSATGSRRMVIGGAGVDYDTVRFVGDIAVVLYIPDVAAHLTGPLKAALDSYLANFVTALSA